MHCVGAAVLPRGVDHFALTHQMSRPTQKSPETRAAKPVYKIYRITSDHYFNKIDHGKYLVYFKMHFSYLHISSQSSQNVLPKGRSFTANAETIAAAHFPTLPSLYLRHSPFSNPSVASPTSQLILQPFFCSPMSQAIHLHHLASRPCFKGHWD